MGNLISVFVLIKCKDQTTDIVDVVETRTKTTNKTKKRPTYKRTAKNTRHKKQLNVYRTHFAVSDTTYPKKKKNGRLPVLKGRKSSLTKLRHIDLQLKERDP